MSPADRDVLTSLPRTRPTRRSAKRGSIAGAAEPPEPAAKPKAAQPKAKPGAAAKPKATAAAKPKAAAAKPKAAAAPKRKPAAPRAKARPSAATAAAAQQATPAPARPAEPPRPQSSTPPPAGWAAPTEHESGRGGTRELLGSVVQGVGEIAQIGLTFGSQALRQALSRLPKP